MAGQNIDDVFAAIIKDCQTIAVEAVKSAAKKVQADILKEAKNYLQEYYDKYDPKQYKRTYKLKRAILPYWADRSTSNGIAIEVGVQYSSSALKGAYRSNSWYHQSGDAWIDRMRGDFNFNSPNNGIPEPDWILDNFLSGVHKWGNEPGQSYEHKDTSTNTLMQQFFDTQLPDRINKYIQNEVWDTIVRRLG